MNTAAFNTAERFIAQQLAADPVQFCMDQVDQTVDVYMGPIANAVLRGDLSDAAMASLGRELLQQYLADVRNAVCEEQEAIEEACAQVEAETAAYARRLSPALRPVGY